MCVCVCVCACIVCVRACVCTCIVCVCDMVSPLPCTFIFPCRVADQDGRPFAAIIWSGAGTVNGLETISCSDGHDEFLVTPKHNVTFANQSAHQSLIILSVYPIVD